MSDRHDHCCHGRTDPPAPDPHQGAASGAAYVCPMCAGVESDTPGDCPKCGMALERAQPQGATHVQYTCPMHPEVVRDKPGDCPICGMALEAVTVTREPEANPELRDMTRRFVVAAILTAPLFALAMGEMLPGLDDLLHGAWNGWVQAVLATPVILWAGLPFLQRGWRSVVTGNLNMFTLIALGTWAARL